MAAPQDTEAEVVQCFTRNQEKAMCDCFIKWPKGAKHKEDTFQCKRCNAVQSRVNRLRESHADLASDFPAIKGEEKDDFFRKASDLLGAQLVKTMSEAILVYKKRTTSTKWETDGQWLDEVEVKKVCRQPSEGQGDPATC